MKKKFYYFLPILGLLSLTACGDDDSNDPTPTGTEQRGGGGGGENNPGSIAEDKEYVESVANDISACFKPEDQKPVVDLAYDFGDLYGDLDIPTVWEDLFDGGGDYYAPAKFMSLIRRAAVHGDAGAMTRAAYYYVYNFRFKDFTGIFEPGYNSWNKTASSNDIVFRFNDRKGKKCELKVTAAGGEWDLQLEDEDYWESYEYNIKVPHTVTVSLTQGGTSLVNIKINSMVDLQGLNGNVDANITIMNLNLAAKASLSNSQATLTSSFKAGTTEIYYATGTVNGNRMLESDWDDLMAMKNATANGRILNKIEVAGNATMSAALNKVLMDDPYWDSYGCPDRDLAWQSCLNVCGTLNSGFSVNLKYGGKQRASIAFSPYLSEWPTWDGSMGWDIWPEAWLKFPDGTLYSFEDYGDVFSGLGDIFQTVADLYENVLFK